MPMIYGLILLGGAVVLALRHAADERPSVRSKRLVGAAVVASVVVPWAVAAAVLQVGACVYVIVYRMVADELPKPDAK